MKGKGVVHLVSTPAVHCSSRGLCLAKWTNYSLACRRRPLKVCPALASRLCCPTAIDAWSDEFGARARNYNIYIACIFMCCCTVATNSREWWIMSSLSFVHFICLVLCLYCVETASNFCSRSIPKITARLQEHSSKFNDPFYRRRIRLYQTHTTRALNHHFSGSWYQDQVCSPRIEIPSKDLHFKLILILLTIWVWQKELRRNGTKLGWQLLICWISVFALYTNWLYNSTIWHGLTRKTNMTQYQDRKSVV